MEAARPRSRRPAEERRAQILEAALHCFARKGFHSATMDDLVRASGLSKGSLYWHFASKEDVFLALFDAFAESVFAEWDGLLAEGLGTLESLERVTLGRLQEIADDTGPALFEFLAHPEARARLASVYGEVRSRLERSLARDMDAGAMVRRPVPGLAAALTGAAEGLALQAMVDPEFDLEAHWAATRALIERGVSA